MPMVVNWSIIIYLSCTVALVLKSLNFTKLVGFDGQRGTCFNEWPTLILKPTLASRLIVHKKAKQYRLQIISSRCLPKETNKQTCQRCNARISQISNRLLRVVCFYYLKYVLLCWIDKVCLASKSHTSKAILNRMHNGKTKNEVKVNIKFQWLDSLCDYPTLFLSDMLTCEIMDHQAIFGSDCK